jgi:hypothetical protein
MTGWPSACNPFRLAFVAVVLAACGAVALALYHPAPQLAKPAPRPPSAPRLPPGSWGHVTAYAGGMFVTLGPAADRRRRSELVFDRVEFSSAGVSISNDRGRTFHQVAGKPMGSCGYHWQGYGLNAIVATRECVPSWATGKGGRTGREWMRLENLVPYARVVLIRFSPRLVQVPGA